MSIKIDRTVSYTPEEFAPIVKKTVGTLAKIRAVGGGCEYVKIGKTILYPGDKILEYFARNTYAHGAAAKSALDLANGPAGRAARALAESPAARQAADTADCIGKSPAARQAAEMSERVGRSASAQRARRAI